MFIIFDLDDTLIDTSTSIAPSRLKAALRFAEERGFSCNEVDVVQLLEQHVREVSSEIALKKFLENHGAPHSLVVETLQEYRALPGPDLEILTVPHALDVLQDLVSHRLAIVTIGREEHQLYKLKKAGIFPSFFSKIVVAEERDKKKHYNSLLEEYGHMPSETVVVGDRVEVDLVPAKELGCSTVRLMRGRGACEEGQGREVDFTIYDLRELPSIIERINNNGDE